MRHLKVFAGAFSAFAILALAAAGTLRAATITVNTTTDEFNAAGNCSLREAVASVNAGADSHGCVAVGAYGTNDTVTIPASATPYDLSIPSGGAGGEGFTAGSLDIFRGDIDITKSLKVVGGGANQTTIKAAALLDDRVFMANLGGVGIVEISGVTITGGTSGFRGGGIWAFNSALTLTNAYIHDNTAVADGGGVSADNAAGTNLEVNNTTISSNTATQRGGGIFLETGNGFITNSTISGNTATGDGTNLTGGGGIDNTPTGSITLINSTIFGNKVTSAGSIGGGLRSGSSIKLKNSIIANNIVVAANQNCGTNAGTITSQGHNLSSDASCALGGTGDQNSVAGTIVSPTLADNVGETLTHNLPSGSPAIDLVPIADCLDSNGAALTTDQRGFARPADGNGDGTILCDAGAVEIGCGNGIVDAGEQCDIGGGAADICAAGTSCVAAGLANACTCQAPSGGGGGGGGGGAPVCGNGALETGEECDDGNILNGDGCSATCTNEGIPACGDGILQGTEACDDKNVTPGDGCSATCTIETGFTCTGAPSSCSKTAGASGGCSLIR